MKFITFSMFALWCAGIVGWVLNIIQLFSTSFDPLTAVAVLRVIGVFFPPLGAVMGYFF